MPVLSSADVVELQNYLDTYISTQKPELRSYYQMLAQATNKLANTVGNYMNPTEQKHSNETELQKKLKKCLEYKNSFANTHDVEHWIKLALDLGKEANISQTEKFLFVGMSTTSFVSKVFHAARTKIISVLTSQPDDLAYERFQQEIQTHLAILAGLDARLEEAIQAGYPVDDIRQKRTATFCNLLNLNHLPTMYKAVQEGIFIAMKLDFPDQSHAPKTSYMPGISHATAVNVHYPWCYQQHWHVEFVKTYPLNREPVYLQDASSSSASSSSTPIMRPISSAGAVLDRSTPSASPHSASQSSTRTTLEFMSALNLKTNPPSTEVPAAAAPADVAADDVIVDIESVARSASPAREPSPVVATVVSQKKKRGNKAPSMSRG